MNGPAGETTGPSLGPVVLDIGGEFGAAVVFAPSEFDGREIEIRSFRRSWDGTHVAVRARPSPGESLHAAVFGRLRSGVYELRRRDRADDMVDRIRVVGGEVTETSWPPVVRERAARSVQRRQTANRGSHLGVQTSSKTQRKGALGAR